MVTRSIHTDLQVSQLFYFSDQFVSKIVMVTCPVVMVIYGNLAT